MRRKSSIVTLVVVVLCLLGTLPAMAGKPGHAGPKPKPPKPPCAQRIAGDAPVLAEQIAGVQGLYTLAVDMTFTAEVTDLLGNVSVVPARLCDSQTITFSYASTTADPTTGEHTWVHNSEPTAGDDEMASWDIDLTQIDVGAPEVCTEEGYPPLRSSVFTEATLADATGELHKRGYSVLNGNYKASTSPCGDDSGGSSAW